MKLILALCSLPALVQATCDGNPHGWGRVRRCDEYDAQCAEYSGPKKCEGIGGIAKSDDPDDFVAPPCIAVDDPSQTPASPIFPDKFVNTGFHEVQIFVKHDPLCLAQIPAMVSNGTHCYKPQEGTFNYDATVGKLRIDYLRSRTPVKGINMTEYFYHEGTCVHPDIKKYGVKMPNVLGGVCPCINVSTGIVAPRWAADAQYVGREQMQVEYLWRNYTVDHFVKGPHHAFVDVNTSRIVRLWQPFNGLEVFDPDQWVEDVDDAVFDMPAGCKVLSGKTCIQAFPDLAAAEQKFTAMARFIEEAQK